MGTLKTWTIMLFIEADGALANFAVESLKQLAKSFSQDAKNDGSVAVAAQFAFPVDAAKAISANAKASGDQSKLFIFKKDSDKTPAAPRTLAAHVVTSPRVQPKTAKLDKARMPGKSNVSESEALKEFLKSVKDSALEANNYALILWGHGPELLVQPGVGTPSDSRESMYITPEQLREALTYWKEDLGGPEIDIVGFDACSMSMFEMACELKGLAKYMVASQEEVPDQSFPYDTLIRLFREHGADTVSLLTEGVKEYLQTYREYIFDQDSGLKPVTLSALNLENCGALKDALRSLACELLKAKDAKDLADLLIEARRSSQDYAGGLYVDLHEFCERLSGQLTAFEEKKQKELNELDKKLVELKQKKQDELDKLDEKKLELKQKKQDELDKLDELKQEKHVEFDKQKTWIKGIQTECEGVRTKLNTPAEGDSLGRSLILVNGSVNVPEKGDPFILVNGKKDSTRSHGISIYLPYLTEEQFNKVNRPLVKGGQPTHGGKGFSDMLNGAAAEYLLCARRELILVTESYYASLQMSKDTNWYSFITEVWTKALIETDPIELDFNYSAQQSWINVSRKPINIAERCKPRKSD
jgi:Clostripain family